MKKSIKLPKRPLTLSVLRVRELLAVDLKHVAGGRTPGEERTKN